MVGWQRYFLAGCCLLAGSVWASTPEAAAPSVPLGTQVDNLKFKDIRYLERSLDNFGTPKAFVLVFIKNDCPLAQRYMPKAADLDKEFTPQGVQFVLVNTGSADTIMDMAQHALEYEVDTPVVKDVHGDVAKALGVTRTPQAVVLDGQRKIVYRGRIDDEFRLGGQRPTPTRLDLREAVVEVLAGKPVSVAETVAEGCLITYAELPKPEQPVTYAEHVAPILNKNCVQCHQKGGGAPITLQGYEKAAAYGDMVAEVVGEERMPPWYAHPDHGTFANEARLKPEERLLIQQWVATGMAKGDAPEVDSVAISPTEWRIDPDVIITARANNAIKATGFVPYIYTMLPHKFEKDTWIEAIEIKASNPRIMHHANLFYSPHGLDFRRSENFLTGQVPGGAPATVPPGHALFVPAGATLGLQLHYVTTGKIEVDRPQVGIRFARGPITKKLYYKIIDDNKFEIPPFARAHQVTSSAEMEADSYLIAMFSHMHLRGRDMVFYATPPEGEREILMSLPNYNFNWQLAYHVDPGVRLLPKGTKIDVVAHFDNSAFNPYNPDPTKTIEEGPQTVDEMMQGFMFYTRNDETLNVKVDPKTGWEVTDVASN